MHDMYKRHVLRDVVVAVARNIWSMRQSASVCVRAICYDEITVRARAVRSVAVHFNLLALPPFVNRRLHNWHQRTAPQRQEPLTVRAR